MTPQHYNKAAHPTKLPVPIWHLLTVGLLCFGIFMLLLGSPDTVWSIDGTGDQFSDSVLEGLSIISAAVAITAPLSSARPKLDRRRSVSLVDEHSLFHPPNPIR